MAGGLGRTTGGVVGGAANTVGNAGGAVRPDAGSAGSIVRDTSALGTNVGESGGPVVSLDHVAGTNMPGVTLSSATSANSSGSLDAAGRNISLDSGTQMTLSIFASQQ